MKDPDLHLEDRSPGHFVLDVIRNLEERGIPSVYLRNHEQLPESVGNDVDLLIPEGKTPAAIATLRRCSSETGWKIFNIVEFGPVSIFLHHPEHSQYLHFDLFERIDWHWAPFADVRTILNRRQWNGMVYHPHPEDEIYLNIMTRLIYHGNIRDKHRHQGSNHFVNRDAVSFGNTIKTHLGSPLALQIGRCIQAGEWAALEDLTPKLRLEILKGAAIRRPRVALRGLAKYLARSLRRLIHPPGMFLVFEGADGVGKSTVINTMEPAFYGLTGRRDTLHFHWKPTRKSIRTAGPSSAPPCDPRANEVRPLAISLAYLGYHWLGFWAGYLRYVYPARIKNRAVVGDRYAYEFFLDPRRLRLSAPEWILKFAAETVPRPSLVLALVAEPAVVMGRKPELTHSEIDSYQRKLRHMAAEDPRIALVTTESRIEDVATEIMSLIAARLGRANQS